MSDMCYARILWKSRWRDAKRYQFTGNYIHEKEGHK
jgi:hypothetical protein